MCEVIHYRIAYKTTDENRLKDKAPEIKKLFLDRIDPRQEIMHNWD